MLELKVIAEKMSVEIQRQLQVQQPSGTASSDTELRKFEERKKGSAVRGCARNFMKIRFWGSGSCVRQSNARI